MFLSLSAANASWMRFLASRYLTIASAVSSEAADTSRSISTALGLADGVRLAGDGEAFDVLAGSRHHGLAEELGPAGRADASADESDDDCDTRLIHS